MHAAYYALRPAHGPVPAGLGSRRRAGPSALRPGVAPGAPGVQPRPGPGPAGAARPGARRGEAGGGGRRAMAAGAGRAGALRESGRSGTPHRLALRPSTLPPCCAGAGRCSLARSPVLSVHVRRCESVMLPYFGSYVKFQRLVQISAEISVMPVTNAANSSLQDNERAQNFIDFSFGPQIVRFQIFKKARKCQLVSWHTIFSQHWLETVRAGMLPANCGVKLTLSTSEVVSCQRTTPRGQRPGWIFARNHH